mgnify:CR=1 FL=1
MEKSIQYHSNITGSLCPAGRQHHRKTWLSIPATGLFSLIIFLLLQTTSVAQTNFCASAGNSQNFEWMYYLRLGSGPAFNLGSSTRVGYRDFTNQVAATVQAGTSLTYEIRMNSTNSYPQQIYFWLDQDQDGTLVDPGERVHTTSKTVNGVTTHTGSFTVPANTGNGTVFGRVIMRYSNVPPLCGTYDYGTTFDFRINVTGGMEQPQTNVTVNVEGSGTVTSNPAGINTTSSQTANFSKNRSVSLTASGSSGQSFSHWTGSGISGTSTSNPYTFNTGSEGHTTSMNFTAHFAPPISRPTVTTLPVTGISRTGATLRGRIDNTGGENPQRYLDISTSSSFTAGTTTTYNLGAGGTGEFSQAVTNLNQSTLYYVRARAHNSAGWSSSTNTVTFTTDHLVQFNAGSNGTVAGNLTQEIPHGGSTTQVAAVPDAGFHFVRWSDNNTSNPRTISNVTGSYTLTAVFSPNMIAVSQQPVHTVAGETIHFSIKIVDNLGNTVPSGYPANAPAADREITVNLLSGPEGGVLEGTHTVMTAGGTASFAASQNLHIKKTGNYVLMLKDEDASANGTLVPVNTQSFTIIPAALGHFTLGNIDPVHVAGTTQSPKVTAYDIFGNLKTNYTGTVAFSSDNESLHESLPTVLPGNHSFTSDYPGSSSAFDNGSRVFVNQLNLKQTSYSNQGNHFYVRVYDVSQPDITGEQGDIGVIAAALGYFELEPTGQVVAGTPFSVAATAFDIFRNVKDNYTGMQNVQWTSTATSSPRGNPRELPDNGPQDFEEGRTVAGLESGSSGNRFIFYNAMQEPVITIIDAPTGSSGTSEPFAVYNEILNNFLVEEVPAEIHNLGGVRRNAGEPFSIRVTARDQYWNTMQEPYYDGQVRLQTSSTNLAVPNTLFPYSASHQGVRVFENVVTAEEAGHYWLRARAAEDPSSTGFLRDIIVRPSEFSPSTSGFTVDKTSVRAGEYVTITVTPRDAYGNLLCTCRDLQVYVNGRPMEMLGGLSLAESWVDDQNVGDGSYSATIRLTETGINTITVHQEGMQLQTVRTVEVSSGEPTYLALAIEDDLEQVIAGAEYNIAIIAVDLFNNITPDYEGGKTLSFAGAQSTEGDPLRSPEINGTPFGDPTELAFTNGIATAKMTLFKVEQGIRISAAEMGDDPIKIDAIHLPHTPEDRTVEWDDRTLRSASPEIRTETWIYQLSLDVQNGPAHYLALTPTGDTWLEGPGNSMIAGTKPEFSIQAFDAYGNPALDYTGSKELIFSGADCPADHPYACNPALVWNADDNPVEFGDPAALSFVNGVAEATLSLFVAGPGFRIDASDGQISGQYLPDELDLRLHVSVMAADPDRMALTIQDDVTWTFAGQENTVFLTAYDKFNNVATTYDGTKDILFTGAGDSPAPAFTPQVDNVDFGTYTPIAFTEGQAQATMVLYRAQDAIVMAEEEASGVFTRYAGLHDYRLALEVRHATPDYLHITGSGTQLAGSSQKVSLGVFDAYNNPATDYTGLKGLVFAGAGSTEDIPPYPGFHPLVGTVDFGQVTGILFTEGAATADMILYKAESTHITVTDSDSGITSPGNKQGEDYRLFVTVSQAPAGYLTVTGSPAQRAGTTQSITINAYDSFNNPATDYSGSKTLVFSGALPSPDPVNHPTINNVNFGDNTSIAFSSGTATANMRLWKTETAMIGAHVQTAPAINAGDHRLEVLVTPHSLREFYLTEVETLHYYGEIQTIAVEAIDQYGNRKTDYTGLVRFNSTDLHAQLPDDYRFLASDEGYKVFENQVRFSQARTDEVGWWVDAHDTENTLEGYMYNIRVAPRPILISASSRTKTYGEEISLGSGVDAFTVLPGDAELAEAFPFMAGSGSVREGISAATQQSDGTPATATVGTYPITIGSLTGQNGFVESNYAISYNPESMVTVLPRPIAIMVDEGQWKYYGENDPAPFAFTVTSDLDLVNGDEFDGNFIREPGEDAGTYAILQAGLLIKNGEVDKSGNYAITFNGADFTIDPLPILVTPDSGQSKVFGQLDPVIGYSADPPAGSILPNGLTVSLSGTPGRETGEDAGDYEILQGSLTTVDNPNYDISFTSDIYFEITRLPVTITADAKSKMYGDADPALTFASAPVVGHVLPNGLVVGFDGALARDPGENVADSPYAILQGSVDNPNYDITFTGASLTICELIISVTADAQSKTYGDLDPDLTFASEPAVGHVLPNGLVVGFSGALERDAGETVADGPYAILLGTLDNPNYDVSYTGDVLTIDPLPVTVTADAKSKVYGDLDPALTFVSAPAVGHELPNGLVVGFDGALERDAGETVAGSPYSILQGSVDNPNYDISYAANVLTINPLPVTVTADAKSKTYGDFDPALTFVSAPAVDHVLPNGLVVGFDGALDRDAGETVADSPYDILQGTLGHSNYSITYHGDVLTINPLPVTVTADAQSKAYGDLDPALTFVSSPAVGHELPNGLIVGFDGALERDAGETVADGPYDILQGTLGHSNYSITYHGDVLTINPLPVTVTADAQSKAYGDLDPALTFVSTPAVGHELPNGLIVGFDGSLFRDPGETVADGPYDILQGTLDHSNYSITYHGDVLTITRRSLEVTADDQSKPAGSADPAFSYQITEGSLRIGDVLEGFLTRTQGEDTGNYPIGGYANLVITRDAADMTANYELAFIPGTLTIHHTFSLKVHLQGAFNVATGEMEAGLAGHIPASQPYSNPPWNYPGTEAWVDKDGGQATVTDWILVELREDKNLPGLRKAVPLHTDGSASVKFDAGINVETPYYVVVWHRNHMPVMSSAPIIMEDDGFHYDFTDSGSKAYGHMSPYPAMIPVSLPSKNSQQGQVFTMIAGDVNANGELRYSGPGNDRGPILARIMSEGGQDAMSVISNGYWSEDVRMNNQVAYSGAGNDRGIILANLNYLTGSSLPTAIYHSSVPLAVPPAKAGMPAEGPVSISLEVDRNSLEVLLNTSEAISGGVMDNLQFTLAWKSGDTQAENLISRYASDMQLEAVGPVMDMEGIRYQVFVSIEPYALPVKWESAFTVARFEFPGANHLDGRIWLANDAYTWELNGSYYVSVWGHDKTGRIVHQNPEDVIADAPSGLLLYPNPVHGGVLTIERTGEVFPDDLEVLVFDIRGRQVSVPQAEILGSNRIVLHTGELPPGVYMIRLKSEIFNQVARVVIPR